MIVYVFFLFVSVSSTYFVAPVVSQAFVAANVALITPVVTASLHATDHNECGGADLQKIHKNIANYLDAFLDHVKYKFGLNDYILLLKNAASGWLSALVCNQGLEGSNYAGDGNLSFFYIVKSHNYV